MWLVNATELIPTKAILRGKRVRVVEYAGNGRWLVLDHNDQYRVVTTRPLTFVK